MLKTASWIGANGIVVHPGHVSADVAYDEAWRWTVETLQDLRAATERHSVAIFLENVWNKFLLSPLEFAALLDEVDVPLVRACFDVGNAVAFGFPEQWIRLLSTRIGEIHIRTSSGAWLPWTAFASCWMEMPIIPQSWRRCG